MPKIPKKNTDKIKKKNNPKNNKVITQFFNKQIERTTDERNKSVELNLDAEPNFYQNAVVKKVNLCGPEKNCYQVKLNLHKKIDTLNEKLKKIQHACSFCLQMCEKKDKKIEILNHSLQKRGSPSSVKIITQHNEQTTKEKTLFEEFSDVLTEEQLGTLRSTNKAPRADSNFVLNTIRFFYSENLEILQNKCAKGRAGNKQPISPVKMNRMKMLYEERIIDLDVPEQEKTQRKTKFDRLVHSAIMNVNKSLKRNDTKFTAEDE